MPPRSSSSRTRRSTRCTSASRRGPEDFGRLLDKIGESMAKDFDFSAEMRGLQVPTPIVAADTDMASPSHYVEAFKLLDGGLRDGGWMGEGGPKAATHWRSCRASRTKHGRVALVAATILDFVDAALGVSFLLPQGIRRTTRRTVRPVR